MACERGGGRGAAACERIGGERATGGETSTLRVLAKPGSTKTSGVGVCGKPPNPRFVSAEMMVDYYGGWFGV